MRSIETKRCVALWCGVSLMLANAATAADATRTNSNPVQLPDVVVQGEAEYQQTVQPVFLVDLTLIGHALERVGGRAWVRFDHGSQPLALQVYRRATQLFLRHFAPSA